MVDGLRIRVKPLWRIQPKETKEQEEKDKFLRGEMGEEVSNVIELYYSRVNKKKAASKLVGNKSGKGGLAFLAAGGIKKKPSSVIKDK